MAERPWKFESSRPHQSGLSVVWQAVSHHHIVRNGPVAKCAMASDAFFSRDDDEIKVVLLARIELAASPLPRECSTTELQQRTGQGRESHLRDRSRAYGHTPRALSSEGLSHACVFG